MRLFFAIDLPAAVKQRVAARQRELQQLLETQGLGHIFRWTPADNLHLTLRFLGETDAAQRRQMDAAVAAAAAGAPAFSLSTNAVGAFPNLRKPNILWLDFAGDLVVLAPLQQHIELAARQAAFAPEERAFKPHLTLARAQKSAASCDLARAGEVLRPAAAAITTPGAPFAVDAIHLIHSDLRPTGPVYTPLATYELGKHAA